MGKKLPSHNVPLSLVADVLCYVNASGSLKLESLCAFTDKSEAYIRSSLAISRLLNILDDDGQVDSFIVSMGKTPNEELKIKIMRKFIQEYEPFITFIQYNLNDSTLDEAARKVYVSYALEGKDYKFLKELFVSWGTTTRIFALGENCVLLEDAIETQLATVNQLNLSLDDDMAIRIYIGNVLGADIFSTLSSAEIEELVDSYKKSQTDARGAIECAGRAFEDFLRRAANVVGVDVSGKNGIGQIVNALYNKKNAVGLLENKIHSKQTSIGAAIGDIRNMAGHSLEARTLERWTLTSHSAQLYIELVLSTMRSIHFYIQNTNHNF